MCMYQNPYRERLTYTFVSTARRPENSIQVMKKKKIPRLPDKSMHVVHSLQPEELSVFLVYILDVVLTCSTPTKLLI